MTVSATAGRLLPFVALTVRFGLGAASLLAAAAVAFVLLSGKWATLSPAGLGLYVVTPLVASLGFAVAAIKLRKVRVLLLVREACLVIVTLLLVEVLLTGFFPPKVNLIEQRQWAARQLGRDFDTRTVTQVVEDLQAKGVAAYPTLPVSWVRQSDARAHIPEDIYPLSNVSNTTIVECNESGAYMTFHSDEYGFQNPPGLHGQQPVQISVVGSSFSLGRCVAAEAGMVDRLRTYYPGTLNFGMTGASSYTMLATFREFVAAVRPRVVLWEIYPGAIAMADERQDPLLPQYLKPHFKQGLRDRQAEVDAILKRAAPSIQREFDNRLAAQVARQLRLLSWANVAKVWQLRSRLLPPAERAQQRGADLTPFVDVLRLVKTEVAQWGGQLYVVYIPTYTEVVQKAAQSGIRLPDIALLLEREQIALIEGVTVFSAHRDPAGLYALRINNHFSEEGHRMMGDLIAQRLRADLGETF